MKSERAAHFEPHIQGLRAIAVLLVVIYHIWPGRLTGGYVGVDVFFVISGFLITGQLAREIDASGRVRLGTFWAKRARRLLPAAILVLMVSALLCLALMPISSLPLNVREILASTFYVENWSLVASSTDYLAGAHESIAQHYWSLSVEEQFYLVWPLLLILAAWLAIRFVRRSRSGAGEPGRRRAGMVSMIAAVTAATFVLSGVLTDLIGPPSYFTTYTRMWEFGVGGLVALLPVLRPRSRWLSAVVGWAGVVLVVGAGLVFDNATPFPGWVAAIPVLGTALAIAARRADAWWLPGRVLAIAPARWIGDISYSLYLWHWPLIIVAPFIPGWPLQWWNRVILLVAAVLLAWATKRWVEDPWRGWRLLTNARARRTAVASLALMAVSAIAVGGLWLVRDPQYRAEASELAAVRSDPPPCFGAASAIAPCDASALADTIIPSWGFAGADEPDHPECLTQLNDATLRTCTFGSTDPAAPRVALVGDSHAYQYLDAMIGLAESNGWSLTTYLKGACPWNAGPLAEGGTFGAACTAYQERLADALGGGEPFDAILTAAFATTEYRFAEGGPTVLPRDAGPAADGYAEAWSAAGAPIIAIRDNPHFAEDPNKCLRSTGSAEACGSPVADAVTDPDPIAVAAGALGPAVTLIDLTTTYCPGGECLPVVNGANVYRDADHLTTTWVSTMAPILEAAVREAIGG